MTTLCLKVMGFEDDPATRLGVLPIVIGVEDQASCPTGEGYTYRPTSGVLANGTDDWSTRS